MGRLTADQDGRLTRAFGLALGFDDSPPPDARAPTSEEALRDQQLARMFGVDAADLGKRRGASAPTPPTPPPRREESAPAPPAPNTSSSGIDHDDPEVLRSALEMEKSRFRARFGVDPDAAMAEAKAQKQARTSAQATADERAKLVEQAVKAREERRAEKAKGKVARKLRRLLEGT